ncbi:transmembrane protein 216-like isoform X1 [Condylostylus longicornis]|uniref:transmembrane protein 216-like isoform X1 n=1 Tax=Condylostylus longicornis TaxID=2530218 RepID=UPI00244E40C9|nr:transmembrane protein 216-like isoform X1 [Condylostylus longicornis]
MNSSLAFEILMYLNSFYFGMFSICELSICVLKAINLNYDPTILLKDSCGLVLLCIVEAIRIVLGRKGSISDRDSWTGNQRASFSSTSGRPGWQVICSVILTFPCTAGVVYFLFFQAHILKLELILCSLMLGMQISEILAAIGCIIGLCRPESYT